MPTVGHGGKRRHCGDPPRHTAGTDGARPEHSKLTHREYGLLAPKGTAVDPADVGDPGSKARHGFTRDQEWRDLEEQGGKPSSARSPRAE